MQSHDLDSPALRVALIAGIHDEGALRLQVFAGVMEPFFEFRHEAALYLHRPPLSAGHLEQQIDFRAGRRAIERGACPLRRCAAQVLDDESFPAPPSNWMA